MRQWPGFFWLATLALVCLTAFQVQANIPVVRAVLFYSPSCPHCHQVITNDLPPLFEKYGDQLRIVGVDLSTPEGQVLFQSAIERFNIPSERQAVPMLIIDDVILLGSLEIPEKLPGMVEAYLGRGGLDWPDIPGLTDALEISAAQETSTPEPTITPAIAQPTAVPPFTASPAQPTALTPSIPVPTSVVTGVMITAEPSTTPLQSGLILPDNPPPSLRDRLARDPSGNALAIVVLIGMLISIGGVLAFFISSRKAMKAAAPPLAIPILCLAGFVIAGYLAYVEVTQATAVCGPVGDCNTVQQSEYARLFGVLPIGLLGLAGYLAILLAWLECRYGRGRNASLASLALLGMSIFGTLFSIYLTFLEPFVIGATCAWCLSSAIIMTFLLLLSAGPGKLAIKSGNI